MPHAISISPCKSFPAWVVGMVLYLLGNELNERKRNLNFERKFGKIIGSLSLYAFTPPKKLQ